MFCGFSTIDQRMFESLIYLISSIEALAFILSVGNNTHTHLDFPTRFFSLCGWEMGIFHTGVVEPILVEWYLNEFLQMIYSF